MRTRRRKRLTLMAATAVLLLGVGVAGADTVPDGRRQDPERFEPPTIWEQLEAPVPGPTTAPPGRGAEVEPERPNDEGHELEEASSHGRLVSEAAHDDSFHGCEKGRHVSEIASSGSHGRGPDHGRPPCPNHEDREDDGHGGPPPWAGPPPGAGPPAGAGPPPGAGPPDGS